MARTKQTLARAGEEGEDGLKTVLKRVFSMVGLRAKDLPVGGDKVLLHRDILKHYGNHTAQEIELAFEMAITDQLDLEAKDVQVYDQFTFAYFARIMNAYRRWAAEVARKQAMHEPPPEPKPLTPKQKALLDLDYICSRAFMHRLSLKPPLK